MPSQWALLENVPGQLSSGTTLQNHQHRLNIPPAVGPGEVPLVFQADAEARKVCDGRRGETAGPLLSSPNSGLLPWLFDKNKTGQSVDMMALELL